MTKLPGPASGEKNQQERAKPSDEDIFQYLDAHRRQSQTPADREDWQLLGLALVHLLAHPDGRQCWHWDALECAHVQLYGGTWPAIERKRIESLAYKLGIAAPADVATLGEFWRALQRGDSHPLQLNLDFDPAAPKKPAASAPRALAMKAGRR